jgi:hypothetical protein
MFYNIHKKNLRIFDIQEKDLKGFTTTEKDRKRSYDKFPPLQFRNKNEDVCDEQDQVKEAAPEEMTYEQALDLRKA